MIQISCRALCFFFFNDTATTEIYTLSLHDALPILIVGAAVALLGGGGGGDDEPHDALSARTLSVTPTRVGGTPQGIAVGAGGDRKSTRLNSSHANISYAVFCLKQKKHN